MPNTVLPETIIEKIIVVIDRGTKLKRELGVKANMPSKRINKEINTIDPVKLVENLENDSDFDNNVATKPPIKGLKKGKANPQ
ncbi:hypothetical protein GCM10028807_28100 [Spirosoma daeguense]